MSTWATKWSKLTKPNTESVFISLRQSKSWPKCEKKQAEILSSNYKFTPQNLRRTLDWSRPILERCKWTYYFLSMVIFIYLWISSISHIKLPVEGLRVKSISYFFACCFRSTFNVRPSLNVMRMSHKLLIRELLFNKARKEKYKSLCTFVIIMGEMKTSTADYLRIAASNVINYISFCF